MNEYQPIFFDEAERLDKLKKFGDLLVRLTNYMDFDFFRPILEQVFVRENKGAVGKFIPWKELSGSNFQMITSAQEFIRLRFSESPADYQRAAVEEAPIKVWMTLINEHAEMREWVAHNKTVPVEVLSILTNDPSIAVRCVVAGKRSLSIVLFEYLAEDAHESVRQRIACNKSAPIYILKMFMNDTASVLAEAAKRRFSC
jgi:nicotinamide mononucleotide adenylyltransferase